MKQRLKTTLAMLICFVCWTGILPAYGADVRETDRVPPEIRVNTVNSIVLLIGYNRLLNNQQE
jgi:hypothetical protein